MKRTIIYTINEKIRYTRSHALFQNVKRFRGIILISTLCQHLYSLTHERHNRVIPRSLLIRDDILTDLEATLGTYKLRSYIAE